MKWDHWKGLEHMQENVPVALQFCQEQDSYSKAAEAGSPHTQLAGCNSKHYRQRSRAMCSVYHPNTCWYSTRCRSTGKLSCTHEVEEHVKAHSSQD